GPGHCAECHSPRNRLGGIIASQRFAGGPDPEGGDGWVPNITPAGIGDSSRRDIERIPENGDPPNRGSAGGLVAAGGGHISKGSGARSRRNRALPQMPPAGRRPEASVSRTPGIMVHALACLPELPCRRPRKRTHLRTP